MATLPLFSKNNIKYELEDLSILSEFKIETVDA